MPMAIPTIAPSASGVSMTRCSPNFLRRPSVTRNTPSSTPTSSPRTMTSSSRSISWWSARLIALTIVSLRLSAVCRVIPGSSALDLCGRLEIPRRRLPLGLELGGALRVDVLEDLHQVRLHPGLGRFHRAPDLRVDLGLQLGVDLLVHQPLLLDVAAEARQRLLGLPRLHLVLAPALRRVVGRRVHREPVGDGLDERRPLALPCALDGLPGP